MSTHQRNMSRRGFINRSAAGLTGAVTLMSAASYSRVKGANDRINIGFLGCGAAMATQAYRRGMKLYWDRQNEEIVDHPVTA